VSSRPRTNACTPPLHLHLSDGRCAARETINRKYSISISALAIHKCKIRGHAALVRSHPSQPGQQREESCRRRGYGAESAPLGLGLSRLASRASRPRAYPPGRDVPMEMPDHTRDLRALHTPPVRNLHGSFGESHETSGPPRTPRTVQTPTHLLWGIYTGAVGNLALSRHRTGETREVGLRPSPRE